MGSVSDAAAVAAHANACHHNTAVVDVVLPPAWTQRTQSGIVVGAYIHVGPYVTLCVVRLFAH
jgi:hypothetical protein